MDKKDNTPPFEELSNGALRRYQEYFELRGENNSYIKSREELLKVVKEHFNKLKIDEEKVIETFMSIEKDQTNEKNNNIRKSIRQQEKSIVKFLDSFRAKHQHILSAKIHFFFYTQYLIVGILFPFSFKSF